MVIGAALQPSMETPLRSVILALVGASSWGCPGLACCFSSNWRIWRSSFKISSPCWRVRPVWSLATWATGATWAASGSAPNNVAYTRNFFIGYLILSQDQQILAVWNMFFLGDEMEMIGLDLLD